MNVVHLSTNDIRGGAARAAYRLHQGLRHAGVGSYIWTQSKTSDDSYVFGPSSNIAKAWAKLRPRLDRLLLRFYPDRERVPYSVQWVPSGIYKKIAQLNPDVINLHWICGGYLNIGSIARLNKPLVWTLHDMWPFTGGCHYDQGCGRYAQSCGACPQLHSRRERDLSRFIWRRKKRAWKDTDLTIVALSQWLAKCACKSSLFKDLRIEIIPNGLDLNRFKPIDKRIAREILNLPLDKQLILFGAMNATSDQRKGFDLLKLALGHLHGSVQRDRTDVIIVGASEPKKTVDLKFESHYLGLLKDNISLNLVYAAADVFVAPSRQDNLPNTVMEALSCGTPCVAFDIGGIPDMIDHHQNGYLAQPFDTEDLAHGIQWVLENENRRQKLSQNARQKAVQEFDQELQARRYLELYADILDRRSNALSSE